MTKEPSLVLFAVRSAGRELSARHRPLTPINIVLICHHRHHVPFALGFEFGLAVVAISIGTVTKVNKIVHISIVGNKILVVNDLCVVVDLIKGKRYCCQSRLCEGKWHKTRRLPFAIFMV